MRTLRYYDRVGLLSPTAHTQAGHRLYTDADFARLQQILALKFLGFSLDDIHRCLSAGPTRLRDALGLQKQMLKESRAHLDRLISALTHAEAVLQDDEAHWEAIIKLIKLFRMNQNFTHQYYTQEQREKLAEWGKNWTVEDQKVASQRWSIAMAELQRLVASGEDPAGPVAQALAREWHDLVQEFTHGDAGIEQALANLYTDIEKMPEEERPVPMPFDKAGGKFIGSALKIYTQQPDS